jgi:hypothetical protein
MIGKGSIKGFTKHGIDQAITRGFKTKDIARIIDEGSATAKTGRYGQTVHYQLGENIVVMNNNSLGANYKKLISIFSTDVANGGAFVPFT